MSEDSARIGPRQSQSPKPFRNIHLTPELIAIGITELQVQAKNMLIRGPGRDETHPLGTLIMTKYDPDDLVKTQNLAESKLAEQKRNLPDNFDPKGCAEYIAIALLNDLQDQFTQAQERMRQGEKQTESVLDEIKALKDENADISFEDWQKTLVEKYNNLKDVVSKKIPNAWAGLEFGISNLRILNIDDCTLPMIGILLGRPGSGKTVAITLLSKWIYSYYTDDFSPKAWVTHTTSVDSPEELALIDMLAKIKDHQFLIPELAMLFGLKEDDLRLALSKITRVADGHGFFSDSGVYGRRGYADIMFVMLAALVDIPNHAYKVMSTLGPRLYFNRLPFEGVTAQDIFFSLTDKETFNSKYKAIENALLDYLKWFEIGPTLLLRTPLSPHLRKIEWNSDKNDVDAIQCISNLAFLLGYLRREGRAYTPDKYVVMDTDDDAKAEKEQKYSYFTGMVEDTKRAGQILMNLARGHALSIGRNYITMEDVGIVVRTVLSTARIERVKAFIALLDTGRHWISREELADALNISLSTAYRIMVELHAIELVDTELTNDIIYTKNNNPANVRIMTLEKDFEWFLTPEFKQLRDNFTPVDNRKFMQEPDPEAEAAKAAAAAPVDDEIKKANNERLRGYDKSQKKISADAAKMEREFNNSRSKSSNNNNDNKRSRKKQ